MSPTAKALWKTGWHFGGLAAVTAGSVIYWGWPSALIVVGTWAIVATIAELFA